MAHSLNRQDAFMSRRIITKQLQSQGGGVPPDTYFDKVVKYIPADINAAWIFVSGLIKNDSSAPQASLLWATFVAGIILTALWTLKQTTLKPIQNSLNRPAITQTVISTGAFMVWVFALGEPFSELGWYKPLYGSLMLVFYTLVVALVTPPES